MLVEFLTSEGKRVAINPAHVSHFYEGPGNNRTAIVLYAKPVPEVVKASYQEVLDKLNGSDVKNP